MTDVMEGEKMIIIHMELEDASTHKSTDPRRQCFCDSWTWPLTFWLPK